MAGQFWRRRISRSLVTALGLTLFTFGLPHHPLVPAASAATVTNGGCSVDGTNTSKFTLIDSLTADGTCMVRFTTGTSSFTLPTEVDSIRAFAVGGGGGGGFGGNGGGGGAGSVIYSTNGLTGVGGLLISATIGAGGLSPISKTTPTDQSTWGQGAQGETTTLVMGTDTYYAVGGGGGGGSGTNDTRNSGTRGGSGGGTAVGGASAGAGFNIDYALWTEAANAGYKSTATSGGAGGGAGAAAINSNGAIGITVLGYKVGGGGAGWSTGTNTVSGPYGGGAPRGTGTFPCTSNTCHGDANTGGGGGGGGDGGSGVALIKYIPARNGGTIAVTGTTVIGRTRTLTFTRTYAVSTGVTASYQWQVKAAGSSTWNNVSTGSGGTTTAYTTSALTPSDSGNSYRIVATDANTTLGISTVTSVEVASAAIPGLEIDYALELNGSTQYATKADDTAFDLSGNFTLEAWVYPTNVTGTSMILNKENSYEIFIKDGVYGIGAASSSGTNWTYAINNIPAVPNEWHHIAYVRVSGQANYTAYLDGVVAYQGPADGLAAANVNNTADGFSIGARSSVTTQRFTGKLDNVAGFGTARNQAQILADMNGYIDANTSGLQYYYDFNEGSGSTVYNHDVSGTSATDLSIVGSATYSDVKSIDNSTAYTQVKFPRTYITPLGGWKSPAMQITYNALAVAGGGAGGARVSSGAGGGGGAGGMIDSSYKTLDTSTIVTVKVGQGGLGAITGTMGTIAPGGNGGNTVIVAGSTSLIAIGGGGGAGGTDSDNTSYNGKSGGSGGGASGSSISGYAGGSALQGSGSGYTGYGNTGGSNPGCPNTRHAGGGGGAGARGQTPSTCSPAFSGSGGAGKTSAITGLTYAGGGGGGTSGDGGVTAGSGGTGGGAAGGTWKTFTADVGTINLGNSATPNTGGGGGGTGIASPGITQGGAGAAGIIVIKYLTIALPTYSDPSSDTTTAGLTYTFTVTGSAPSPWVRTYKWQSSIDTGTTWSDITTGSGYTTASYTTSILETMTSGFQYQYRVMVIDTSGGTVVSDLSTSAYLTINARLVLNGSYTIMKYGTIHTDTFTVPLDSGTGVKTVRRTSSAKQFITWDTSTANTAAVTVGLTLPAGTYYDTITVTDERSVTSNFPISITVLKADTITVTAADRIDTYTASSLTYVDTFTVSGLVAGDTMTAVTYTYTGTANDGTQFTNSARPAIAGTYSIKPNFTIPNAVNYETVTVTSGTLTINRKLRTITMGTKPTTLKYGDTSTVVATASDGTSDGAMIYQSSTASLCTFTGAVITAIETSGSCAFTATIGRGNNYETATTLSASATLSKADTLTVTVLAITPLTYSASQAVVNPTISISGLKLTDTATSTSATFTFNSLTSPTIFTGIKPTNSDTYTVRADTLTVTSGILSRYQGVVYVDGVLRINRAQQAPLVIPQFVATYGQPYRAIILGGSGTGLFTETVSAGTAAGCTLSGDTVTTTSQGTCFLHATKARDQNYETATVSGEIYFLIWSTNPQPATTGNGPTIAINGEVSITRDPNAAPTITDVGTSGDATYPIAITGAGFASPTAGTTVIKFWRNKVVAPGDFIIKSDTLIWTKQPLAAITGKVLVTNANGMAVSIAEFTPLVLNP